MGWVKLFGAFVAIPLGALGLLLAFLGVRGYQDFANLMHVATVEVTGPTAGDRRERRHPKENHS
jgi:hypothetical protein